MADPREFVLIGSFTDGITPSLEKINDSINTLKQNLNAFGSKRGGFNDLTKSMGKVIGAHIRLKEEVADLRKEMRDSLPVLREYRREVGKAVSANMHMAGGKRFIKKSNPYLQFLDQAKKQTDELAKASQNIQLGRRIPRTTGGGGGGGGGGPRPPRPASMPAGGGGYVPQRTSVPRQSTFGTNKFGVSRDAEFAFGQTLGFTLGTTVTNAVVQGFQIGVGLMMQPFQYFAGAFGERIKDELDDLKAAGGLYSVSKRSANPFLANIDEAIQFQQKTNETFAKMAASLPGVTNDYVQVGKRLSDTAARIVSTDFEKARTEANRIRATEEGRKFYGGTIAGTGAEQQRQVITTLLGELTKKTTLAGLGGRTGAGGVAGAYGLPGLTERMLSQEQVSMGQFQRYAAVFSDPAIADALNRNIDKINATQLNTIERFKAIQKLLDEVVTPELVEKLRTSVDGIYQGLRSAIVDPDTGLFGLGRNFKEFGRRLNQYGQYVNEANEVVTDLSLAAKEDLSIFEILRDIFVNAGQVLTPIVENLYLIFDPLKKVADVLMDARHYTAEFARTFNQYREGLKALSETPGMDFIKDTLDIRASLSAINNLLLQFGVIGRADFDKLATQLTSKDLDIGAVLEQLIDKVLNSKIAYQIGELIGEVIGTVLSELSKAVGFLAGVAGDDSSELFKGLKKGFEEAGGAEAFRSIIQNVFKALIKGIFELFKIAPLELSILSALALLGPALIASFSVFFANLLEHRIMPAIGNALRSPKALGGNLVGAQIAKAAVLSKSSSNLANLAKPAGLAGAASSVAFRPVGPRPPKGFENIALPGKAPTMVGGVTGPYTAPKVPKKITPLKRSPVGMLGKIKGKGVGMMASAMVTMGAEAPKIAKAAEAITRFGKGTLIIGGLDAALRLASGKNVGSALGGAAASMGGSITGAAIGSMIAPGIGTAVGGVVGGIVGDQLFNFVEGLNPWANRQEIAAEKQMAAAEKQLAASNENLRQIGVPNLGAINQAIADPGKLYQVLQMMGLEGDKMAQSYLQQAGNFQALTTQTKNAKDSLFTLVENLKAAGYTPDQIWKQTDVKALQVEYQKLTEKTKTAGDKLKSTFDKMPQEMSRGISTAMNKLDTSMIAYAIANKINLMDPSQFYRRPGTQQAGPGGTSTVYTDSNQLPSLFDRSAGARWGGGLGDAIASEMKNKPRNSSLVVANSSETVIPAAGGHGMMDFIETFRWGFSTMIGAFKQAQQKQDSLLNNINQTLKSNQQATNVKLTALEKKFTTPGMTGGLGGGAAGGVDAFTGMAQRFGLTMTSAYRPGDPGWHGANRARDFSNGTGPTPQMMEFAQFLASNYGANLKELIYTPLGFSIKNGQKVAPYAQGSHYNHVHVAYAMGLGNGMAFSSLKGAQEWENSMMPGSVRVASVTGNSAEGFGGNTYGDINVTVNAGSVNDPDELASIVAIKISEAVSDARAASLFV